MKMVHMVVQKLLSEKMPDMDATFTLQQVDLIRVGRPDYTTHPQYGASAPMLFIGDEKGWSLSWNRLRAALISLGFLNENEGKVNVNE